MRKQSNARGIIGKLAATILAFIFISSAALPVTTYGRQPDEQFVIGEIFGDRFILTPGPIAISSHEWETGHEDDWRMGKEYTIMTGTTLIVEYDYEPLDDEPWWFVYQGEWSNNPQGINWNALGGNRRSIIFDSPGNFTVFGGKDGEFLLNVVEATTTPPTTPPLSQANQQSFPEEYRSLYNMLLTSDFQMLFGRYTAFTNVYMDNISLWDVFALGLTSSIRNAVVSALFWGGVDGAVDAIMNNPSRVQAVVRNLINAININIIYEADKAAGDVLSVLSEVFDLAGVDHIFDQLKNINGGIEVMSRASQEYEQNIAMLLSIRRLNNAPLFVQTIDSIIAEYQKGFAQALGEYAVTIALDSAIDDAVKFMAGKYVKPITVILDVVIGFAPSITGLETIIVTNDINLHIINAFRNAGEKIVSGNFTEADVESYRTAFYLARGMQIMRYEAMRSQFRNGSAEQLYIDTQLTNLRQMTHTNFIYSTNFTR